MARESRAYWQFAALTLAGLCSLACAGRGISNPAGEGGSGQTIGGNANAGADKGPGGVAGAGAGATVDPSGGELKLRILTQYEYKAALSDLLGPISSPLELPPDTFLAGFTSIGGAEVAINSSSVGPYEAASRAATAEVFADAARWQKLVGCKPKADLGDACVVTFIESFGKQAFRRSLDDAEVQQWLQVAQDSAQLPGASAEQGLATAISGMLQSPFFLYRIETNKLDASNGRLKYDGPSMATRLAFLLTGHPPSSALLEAGVSGKLDTAEGVKAAAAPLLNDPNALERMAAFFGEVAQAHFVSGVQKSPELFPTFNQALQSSMLQATQLFISDIVLAPGADVRSFFDSDQTFVDAALAPIYGVAAPASGFAQITLGANAGRAGILGQAAVLAGHSQSDRTSPTRRGVFISETLLCQSPPVPPDGVITVPPSPDPNQTTRQQMAVHLAEPSCRGCHELIDPYGYGLEHLDAIGKYRALERNLPIDATGTLDGVAFDGAAELGAALAQSSRAMTCMVSNFYRSANGRIDATADAAQIDDLTRSLAAKRYVWRDLVADFVVSDAFRSAPQVGIQ